MGVAAGGRLEGDLGFGGVAAKKAPCESNRKGRGVRVQKEYYVKWGGFVRAGRERT